MRSGQAGTLPVAALVVMVAVVGWAGLGLWGRASTCSSSPSTSAGALRAASSRGPVHLAALGLPEELLTLIPRAVTSVVWPAPLGTTLLVSAGGVTQADAQSLATGIGSDGRYIFFISTADNLGGGTAGLFQVYRHDNSTGLTDLASVGDDHLPGNQSCVGGTCSSDGLHVAFLSGASNIVAGIPAEDSEVYVHDMVSGANHVASVYDGTTTPASDASDQSMSGDGSRVAFTSSDAAMVAGLTGLRLRVFLHDSISGATKLISSSTLGADATDGSDYAAVSSDGTHVAFDSGATNLVTAASNGKLQVFVKNVATGDIKLASSTSTGTQGNNDSALLTVSSVNQAEPAAVSSDGTYVAFTSKATNLVTGGNGQQHVYRKNVTTGDIQIVSQVETAPDVWTQGNGASNAPSISADGRYVAFVSKATNLVTPSTDVGSQHVYVRDMTTGAVQLASVSTAGVRGAGASLAPLISSNGKVLAFSSDAANLVVSDTNSARDAFLHVLGTQTGLVGDVNGDGVVDINDLATMINEWKTRARDPYTSYVATGGNTINADINGDGKLNRDDVQLLLDKLLPLGL